MLLTKLTKLKLPLSLCIISALFAPTITQASTDMVLAVAETGSIAASKAADQKEALAKKAADRKKAVEAQNEAAVEKLNSEKPAVEQKEAEPSK